MTTSKFETITCSRCNGSGNYSYCQRFGTTCFKCLGKGVVLSKRGRVARSYWEASIKAPASELVVGDFVHMRDGGWRKVLEVSPNGVIVNGVESLKVFTQKVNYNLGPDRMVMRLHNDEHRIQMLSEALEYQENLTKAGKPRKRKAA